MRRSLEEVANEYVTQDNLCTAHPIGFIVTDLEEVYNHDGDGDAFYVVWNYDRFNFSSREEMEEFMEENGIEDEDEFDEIISQDLVRSPNNYHQQIFLTKSGVEEHMRSNAHHYNEPKSLLIHAAWRNPDMDALIGALYRAATVPMEEWNHEARSYYQRRELGGNKNQ